MLGEVLADDHLVEQISRAGSPAAAEPVAVLIAAWRHWLALQPVHPLPKVVLFIPAILTPAGGLRRAHHGAARGEAVW